jgi:structural maintenance of chromosomes protein 5
MERATTAAFAEEVQNVFEALGLRGGSGTEDDNEDIMSQDGGPDLSFSEEDGADDFPASDAGESPTANGARPSGYQPGAIVRVTVDNFVTYEHAEFRPGPNLNMIIGPNGTGKSSLVCAICLGLGYHSNVLGRATTFGEFVKHGRDHATVEIELQKRPHDPANFVVKLLIDREDNSRKFWINGRESKQKNLQKLTRAFHIQIDNLCQFLPQDKVAEFAGLNSVELLAKTLQAAAPEQMIQWQKELKALFVSQKDSLSQLQVVTEKLKSQESRQQNLQQDVQRLRDRQQVQRKVDDLNDARVVVQYTLARRAVNDAKEKKKATQLRLRQLEEECGPVMQAVNRQQEYGNKVKAYLETRKAALVQAEQAADDAAEKVETANRTVREFQARHEVEKKKFNEKKQDLSKLRTKVTNLEAQLKQKPREFDSAEWNTKIREQEHQQRDIQTQLSDLLEEHRKVKELGQDKRTQAIAVRDEIAGLDSQKGQLLSFLKRQHPDAAKGWQWIQDNQGEFEKEVFGPPMLTCSVKDERYSELVQALLQKDDFLCFTTQSREDHKKLSHQFYKVMGLTVTIRTCLVTLDSFRSPLPANQLGSFGLDGYVLDFLEGPDPVLAMLCNEKKLHASGVSLKDVTEQQYDSLVAGAAINSWAAGRQLYRVIRRREYGPGAVSTTTRTVPKGQFWTDQPVDAAERIELQRKLDAMEEEVQRYLAQWQGGKNKINALREQDTAIEKKIVRCLVLHQSHLGSVQLIDDRPNCAL